MFLFVVLVWTATLIHGCSKKANQSPLVAQINIGSPSPSHEENAAEPIAETEEISLERPQGDPASVNDVGRSQSDHESVIDSSPTEMNPPEMPNAPIPRSEVRVTRAFHRECNGPRRPRGYAHVSVVSSDSNATGIERITRIVCSNGQDKEYKMTVVNRRCPDVRGHYWIELEREVDEFCHRTQAEEDPNYQAGESFGRFEVNANRDDFQSLMFATSVCEGLYEEGVGIAVIFIAQSRGLEIHALCTRNLSEYRSQSPWIRECPSSASLRAELVALCSPSDGGGDASARPSDTERNEGTFLPSHDENRSDSSQRPHLQQSELFDAVIINSTPIPTNHAIGLGCNGPRRPRGYAHWLIVTSESNSRLNDRITKIVCGKGIEKEYKITTRYRRCPDAEGYDWLKLAREIDEFCGRNQAPEDPNYRSGESFGSFQVAEHRNDGYQDQQVERSPCQGWAEEGVGNANVFITDSSGLEMHAFCSGDGKRYSSLSPWIRQCPLNTSLIAAFRALCTPPNTTEDEDNKCPICHDSLKSTKESGIARELNCRHAFHIGCISRWLRQTRNCPVCRQPQEWPLL